MLNMSCGDEQSSEDSGLKIRLHVREVTLHTYIKTANVALTLRPVY